MSKASRITTDIETYRTLDRGIIDELRSEAIGRRPAQNVKVEIKAAWDTEMARETRAREAVEKTAVDVLLAEPLCACWLVDGKEMAAADLMPVDNAHRVDQLRDMAMVLNDIAGPETIWCGHNIAGFDLPVLLNTFRRYGIRPPEHFPRYWRRRWSGRVFDTMDRTPCANGLNYVSLDDVCRAYGMGSAKTMEWRGAPMDGSRVGDAYDAGEYGVIIEYCMGDVRKEDELYLRVTCDGEWGTFDTHSELFDAIQEINASGMNDTARKLAIYDAVNAAGLLPKAV